jgi:hypothetical protein
MSIVDGYFVWVTKGGLWDRRGRNSSRLFGARPGFYRYRRLLLSLQ